MPTSSFANFRTQPVYPLLQEAFLGSLVRIKCPLSVFQRPWSLATEVVCPPVGFPYLTQPLQDETLAPPCNPRVQLGAWHTVGTRQMFAG